MIVSSNNTLGLFDQNESKFEKIVLHTYPLFEVNSIRFGSNYVISTMDNMTGALAIGLLDSNGQDSQSLDFELLKSFVFGVDFFPGLR